MSVSYGYIPAPLAQYATWLQNFSDVLNATPAAYMVSPGDAASVKVVNDNFQAAYLLSGRGSPSTRTPTTVAATVAARSVATMLVRSWASQIRLNPGVTDMDKVTLGLRLPNNSPSPIPKPATWPVLSIHGYGPLIHQLKMVDSSTPALKAKPYGAIGAELFIFKGTIPQPDFNLCTFFGIFTKNYPVITYNSGDAGKIATYFARWVTRGASDGSTESNTGPEGPSAVAGIGS